ncbi:prephenate dehydratase [Streptomyces sulfonofaciens]|uniref:Prephenate dehydratase n=1 Tax=Streptomyces sulfonofaciens TaxID=68272 RepID=A0A919GK40_9ACTN|nr:DUF2470 domain-containing protein [Streptomyces sulfonofaciens]GHH86074.1 prephenate dehydratase [Streptomyces sulfonofaciens]
MRLTDAPARPTAAERVRSVLAAAQTMTVVTERGRTEVFRAGSGRLTDRLPLRRLLPPAPGARCALPGGEGAAATLEFTDIAPISVRDRIRARVVLPGWLCADGVAPGLWCLAIERAVLCTADGEATVGLQELLTAPTDPLAVPEAGMLTHLAGHHGDLVPVLMRLVEPRLRQAVVRAVPLALDRYGITLRLEYARHHRDVRLAFGAPVDEAVQIRRRIQSLLVAAHRAPYRGPGTAHLGHGVQEGRGAQES